MQNLRFVYAFVNPGLEAWLKEEVKIRALPWAFSFSKPGFLTFKVTDIDFDFNQRLDLAFARSWGLFEAKELDARNQVTEDRIWESFEVKAGEHWQGSRLCRDYIKDRPMDALEFIEIKKIVSRTYYKTAQAFEYLTDERFKMALEIGCAPGGSVSFLLQQGMEVVGIDPGEMDADVLKHTQFTHHQWPIQRLSAPEISGFEKIDLLSVDLNLKPGQALDEVLRFIPQLKGLKLLLMIFKVSRPEEMRPMMSWLSRVQATGAKDAFYLHLPAHRHETLLVARYS
jgi:23S rRNA (cytidine2498-2'-O)-methyltransferase